MEPRRATSHGAGETGPARRPVPAQRRKGEARPVPVPQEAFAHLSVEALRDYRRALNEEEGKVSYWRRLLQGRLDVVTSGAPGVDPSHARLGSMLASERVGAGRRALAAVVPTDDVPPLPLLAALWERQPDPADESAHEQLVEDLRAAESQLSSYRSALHARIAEVTGELIARYRVEPALCLTALPLPRAGG